MTEQIDISSSNDLCNGLCDLRGLPNEARDEGFPVSSGLALENANCLLRRLYRDSPCRYEVYPTRDGEIAIDTPGGLGRSVVLVCYSAGGALCLVNIHGYHRRWRYAITESLPDSFAKNALLKLPNERHRMPTKCDTGSSWSSTSVS